MTAITPIVVALIVFAGLYAAYKPYCDWCTRRRDPGER